MENPFRTGGFCSWVTRGLKYLLAAAAVENQPLHFSLFPPPLTITREKRGSRFFATISYCPLVSGAAALLSLLIFWVYQRHSCLAQGRKLILVQISLLTPPGYNLQVTGGFSAPWEQYLGRSCRCEHWRGMWILFLKGGKEAPAQPPALHSRTCCHPCEPALSCYYCIKCPLAEDATTLQGRSATLPSQRAVGGLR